MLKLVTRTLWHNYCNDGSDTLHSSALTRLGTTLQWRMHWCQRGHFPGGSGFKMSYEEVSSLSNGSRG